ncbi:uncharacterized protein F4807DRAFT_464652 [Annulohypoxylon truncatum]|uniref:uncharacterized protein n=1 Tax=Annulohypoxylon truncatum TaxID=327061 RepID=UPI00200746D5|nr:uncharacterized protein F4807DRAFT_464652 [Annulohypoxylon truncatum]KAI1205566.1 hypothetical protein F4807DRAFT_464652 [Annulohypoxylon truncatum]
MANLEAVISGKTRDVAIIILTKHSEEEAEGVLAKHEELGQFCEENFPMLVRMIFGEFEQMPYNSEIRHLLFRIISIKFDDQSRRPFEQIDNGPRQYALWLKEFIERSEDRALPEIPYTIQTLQYIRRLLESIEFWIRRIHLDRSKTYKLGSAARTMELVLYHHLDNEDEHSFNRIESYRIRRALLIYQLYCMLFRHSKRRYGMFPQRRIPEQMLFLQSLQPFLLKELDAVYGMVECHLAAIWRMGTSICRKATPLHPGLFAVPSGSRLEYIMGLGLLGIKRLLLHDEFHAGLDASDEDVIDDYDCWGREFPGDLTEGFFTRPLRYCYERSQGEDRIIIPNMVSPFMARWQGAPDGANGPSWLARSFSDPSTSLGIREKIVALIDTDPHNWNGLAFWEENRLIRHFQLLRSDSVIGQAFPIADHNTTRNAADRNREERFREMDPRTASYHHRHLSFTQSKLLALRHPIDKYLNSIILHGPDVSSSH